MHQLLVLTVVSDDCLTMSLLPLHQSLRCEAVGYVPAGWLGCRVEELLDMHMARHLAGDPFLS
jgi:hypothetical protein